VTGGGNASGQATVTVAANAGPVRTGTVTIAGQTFTASQAAAAACSYSIAPTTQSMPAQGGSVSVHVTTTSDCAWTATAGAPWITVTSGGSGHGNGTVTIAVAANTGSARNGTVTIAGDTFAITQAAPPCSFALAPRSKTLSSAAGGGMVTVTTQAECTWTASTSDPDWLSITEGKTGTGNGTVTYAVTANTKNKARTGHLTIGGQTFDVTQNGSKESDDAAVWTFPVGYEIPRVTFSAPLITPSSSAQPRSTYRLPGPIGRPVDALARLIR
jgi:hypothetical protein